MSDMHDTHNEYTSNAVVKCQKKRYNTKVLNKYKCTKTTIVVLYGIIHA
jgi:zona occludens toxin (predicted ATPase)